MIYLDGHSTTPLDPQVFEVMKPYFLERYGNASQGLHRYNWEAQAAVENAREQIAQFLGCTPKEIIFTSGATESNHLGLLGIATTLRSKNRMKILSTEIEHASVLGPLELLQDQGFQIEYVKVDSIGRVDENDFSLKLTDQVGLVSIALANHEIGTIQDVQKFAKLAHAHGAFFHTDAVQGFGKLHFTVDSLGVDLMTVSGHKIYGPKGIGALYVRRKNPRAEIEPLFLGGGQERGMRPGTPNVPAIVGLGKAVELCSLNMDTEATRVKNLRDLLWSELESKVDGLIRNGCPDFGLVNNLNLSVEGVDGTALFGQFKNVALSNASACLNGTQDYSQVLTVLGVNKRLARATLRFGLGRFNTEAEIKLAADEIISVIKSLRQMEKSFAVQSGMSELEGE